MGMQLEFARWVFQSCIRNAGDKQSSSFRDDAIQQGVLALQNRSSVPWTITTICCTLSSMFVNIASQIPHSQYAMSRPIACMPFITLKAAKGCMASCCQPLKVHDWEGELQLAFYQF